MSNTRPHLNDYELLLQLGHTADYQTYLARRPTSPHLLTLRQARKERDVVDCTPLQDALEGMRLKQLANLPRVLDVGSEEDRLFWVSEYVEGEMFDAVGGRSLQVPSNLAARLSIDVAIALHGLGKVGSGGPILRPDVHVGVDGMARVIPPLTWNSAPRRDVQALAKLLPALPAEVVYVCAFLWEAVSGLALSACREADGWPLVSTLGAAVTPKLDGLLSDVLHGRARFEQLRTFAGVIEQCADGAASREEVRNWLFGLVRARLEGRATVLRSRIPATPSVEIPLVRVPTDLDTARFLERMSHVGEDRAADYRDVDGRAVYEAADDTERPQPLPTLRSSEPPPADELSESPPSSVRASSGGGGGAEAVPLPQSSVPPSSIRNTHVTPPAPAGPVKRAPLENALAELVERSRNGRNS